MNEHTIATILSQMGFPEVPESVIRIPHTEGEGFYNVWKIRLSGKEYIVKEAKEDELSIYRCFFTEKCSYAPVLLAETAYEGRHYLLLPFAEGEDLCRCRRDRLKLTLDSLIAMQKQWWQSSLDTHYEKSLSRRLRRREYLRDPQLEQAYDAYLRCYTGMSRSLCHDDLLPFNVLCDGDHAVFIDWEVGGILPYMTSLARLIAHTEQSDEAFFYMSTSDRQFAAEYYYKNFVCDCGIDEETYYHSLELFLFYEYCEWIYVGNRYNDTNSLRFQTYLRKAKDLATKMGF